MKYFLSLGLCCSLSADPGELGVVTEGSTSVNSGQTVTAVAPRIPVELSVMGPQGSHKDLSQHLEVSSAALSRFYC